jgi:hypothetical protein
MNILDVMEMMCDWLAAGERAGASPEDVLQYNIERFGVSEEMAKVMLNSLSLFPNR